LLHNKYDFFKNIIFARSETENMAAGQKLKKLILLQVSILLYVAYILTYYFWSRNVDPDNSTIPYLTALGDLLGVIILGLTFEFLYFVGDKQMSV
jgi:hypothetical protein